jgi:single-strand DNA-binding protein
MSLNKVMLIGNLGKDPEVKYTQAQMAIANFSVATTERKKNADGQWAEVTEWHNVVTFGKTAENCGQYLTKGKKVYVEGSIKTRKWQDKNGQDRWTTEVIANTVQFLSAKGEGSSSRGGDDLSGGMERSYTNEAPSFNPSAAGSGVAPVAFDDDDIPF